MKNGIFFMLPNPTVDKNSFVCNNKQTQSSKVLYGVVIGVPST